ncbi:carboxypeptidase-like regulatory domain-containing protein [Bacteroides sp.]|uniref:carboxypeptidase-like regulatory domain-containing protein n=1 Tax=Bacteroides sp. TaxID=29523 RepID=UPI0025BC9A98|nr:carboxypeptidase regulatory-like domain-containing protein [Bacteroides sp.]
MKSEKWLYACFLALVFGVFSFAVVACHDDDDPEPEAGEVIDTPKPVVEFYIMGTVTSKGEAKSGVSVKVGEQNCTTDSEGKFSVTEKTTGTYTIEVAPKGYLAQKTSAVIADNAENRTVVTVAFALTEESPKEEVNVNAEETITVEDKSQSNVDLPTPEDVKPEDVVEDRPLTTVTLDIPAGAIDEENEHVADNKVDISVTTFVPAPEEVTTKVVEENKPVEKSIPLAAAHFEPSGLTFKTPVTISIPNPIPGVSFADGDVQLTYLNPATGDWEVQKEKVTAGDNNYQAPVNHFSAYAIENKVTSTVSKETIQKEDVLGQASQDNSENPKAVTGIVLKYKEKAGWDYEGDIVQTVKKQLTGANEKTINAMVAYLKTRMFALMGSVSGIASTERVYNTVNVNGYTKMDYSCFAKTRITTLKTKVVYNKQNVTIEISAKRYTGTDHQYKTVTFDPRHSGGKGGNI